MPTTITGIDISTKEIDVDSGTLFVDSANGRIGVGTSSPSKQLDVNGTIRSENQFQGNTSSGSSSPAFSFDGDADTGMFGASLNVLGFATNGSERMRVDSSGNVGIGTSSPNTQLETQRQSSSYIAGQFNFSDSPRVEPGESVQIDLLLDGSFYFDFVMTACLSNGFDSDRLAARQHRFRGWTNGSSFLLEDFSEVYNETNSARSRLGVFTCTLPGSDILRFTMPNTGTLRIFGSTSLLSISGFANRSPQISSVTVV